MQEYTAVNHVQDVRMPARKQAPLEGWISVEDAGKLVGVSRVTAYKLAAIGGEWETSGVRIYRPVERSTWVERASLLAWIKSKGGPELQ